MVLKCSFGSLYDKVYKKRDKKLVFWRSENLVFNAQFDILSKLLRTRNSSFRLLVQRLGKSPSLVCVKKTLLEINKMQEPEILKKLLHLLAEGTNYFLSEQHKNAKQQDFYSTIATALGWFENPKAALFLLHSLEKMKEKLVKITAKGRSVKSQADMRTS